MAILGKIRQRSFFLIVIIALALFSFVLMDLIQAGGFGGSNSYVGSINGKDIPFEEFNLKVANTEKNGNNGQGMSNTQAANQVWDAEVNIALLEEEFEKLGIRVGADHVVEILKQNPSIAQRFTNELGGFDKKKFDEFIKSSANAQDIEFLKAQEQNAVINAKYQIYMSMLRGGLFVTQADAKFQHRLENEKVSFDYVHIPYSSIKDSDVKVTDVEVLEYMKKRPKRYKSEEIRDIDFVFVSEEPTADDKNEVKVQLEKLMENRIVFNKTTNANDTLPGFKNALDVVEFVNSNSDFPYDSTYVAKTDLPADHAEGLYNLADGAFYGPYELNGYLAISKSLGKKSGVKARASHVLISYTGSQAAPKTPRTKEEAKAKAEEILAKVNADSNQITMLAFTDSDDQGSAQRGGDLDFFNPGMMVKPFNDFVFNNPIGKVGLVETDFGYHIIKVTDKQDAIRLATVARKINPSQKTSDNAYSTAMKVEMNANDKSLEKAATEAKLEVKPVVKAKPMDEFFGELGAQRQIIRWAYNKDTKVNDIKQFEITNKGYVIARLKSINDTGLMPLEDAKPGIEPLIRNEKKAKMIIAKIKGNNLDAIAKENKVTVESATDLTIQSPIINNAGFEPKVVGVALNTKANNVSAPVEGNSGVYVVKTKAVTKAPETKDFSQQITTLQSTSGQAANRIFGTLKDKADIKDYRVSKFGY
ncbi:MAG: peptidylprolyl isomerase [Flavobacteriales bacterium]|nr:peptidylprolyl isomerase [Flavobacteriales bacterium]